MMLANTGFNGEPMETPSICLQYLLLELNAILAQAPTISFFIVRFDKVVRIVLLTYRRVKIHYL